RVRTDRACPSRHGSAERDVRTARARDYRRHHRRVSEQRPHLPQCVLVVEDANLRPRPLRHRSVQVDSLRPRRHRARVLRDSFAYERVHSGVLSPLFRRDRSGGPLSHRERAAGQLPRDRLERGAGVGTETARGSRGVDCGARLHAEMKALSSLRSRIFLASALLVVLSIGTATYVVGARVGRELEGSLQRDIASTGRLVEQLRTTRGQTFTMMAQLIADAPKLKAAVDTNDPPTVQNNAIAYQDQL